MPTKYKNLINYALMAIVVFGLVKGCDYITKKPEPVSREVDPRILKLDSEITVLKAELGLEAKRRDSASHNFALRLDSIKLDHKKAKNEHKKLKNTPDGELIHYRDSVRRANGIN